MKSVFSVIVIVSIISYVIWFFMPFVSEYLYDYETLRVLQWSGYGSKIDINGSIIPYVFGVVYLVTSFGLLAFQAWARTLFLALTVLTIVSAPFWGLNVQGGYSSMVGYIVTLCDGAILSLAYLSSLGGEFRRNT